MTIELLVIGAQPGAEHALVNLLERLPGDWQTPILIACRRQWEDGLHERLWAACALPVLEPYDKDPLRPGHVLLSPPGYQLLVDRDAASLAPLRAGTPEPLLDRLFESAVDAYGAQLLGVLLSAGGVEGVRGLNAARAAGAAALTVDVTAANATDLTEFLAGQAPPMPEGSHPP